MFGTCPNHVMQIAKVLNDVDYTPKNKFEWNLNMVVSKMEYPLSGCHYQVQVVSFWGAYELTS